MMRMKKNQPIETDAELMLEVADKFIKINIIIFFHVLKAKQRKRRYIKDPNQTSRYEKYNV